MVLPGKIVWMGFFIRQRKTKGNYLRREQGLVKAAMLDTLRTGICVPLDVKGLASQKPCFIFWLNSGKISYIKFCGFKPLVSIVLISQ